MFNTLNLNFKTILSGVSNSENIKFVYDLFKQLSYDKIYTSMVFDLLQKNKPETRCFTSWFANNMKPKRYLEIGVRRGWTLATVAKRSPQTEIYAFDNWIANYARSANPGPDFVLNDLKKNNINGNITFINGDSHKTLPVFISNNKTMMFDLVLIDGDHSPGGATKDILDIVNNIEKGGVLILDDIKQMPKLGKLWGELPNQLKQFKFFSFMDCEPGVGVAIRQR